MNNTTTVTTAKYIAFSEPVRKEKYLGLLAALNGGGTEHLRESDTHHWVLDYNTENGYQNYRYVEKDKKENVPLLTKIFGKKKKEK